MNIDLNNQQHYNIAAALRGPDSNNCDLKDITTAVVRYLAGMTCPNGAVVVNSPTTARRLWNLLTPGARNSARAVMLEYSHSHFMQHIHTALMALETLNKDGAAAAHAEWLSDVKNGAV